MVMQFPLGLIIITHFLVFFSFVAVALILILVGKGYTPARKITYSWVTLAYGVVIVDFFNLIKVAELIQLLSPAYSFLVSNVTNFIGGILIAVSVVWIVAEKDLEVKLLRQRHAEIYAVMKNLKEKYYTRTLSAEDLRKIYAEFAKELAEIEVKLRETTRQRI